MKSVGCEISDIELIEVRRFGDSRGWFCETWQDQRYREHGIELPFVQDNLAFSERGVLRGLHAQNPYAQGKLVSVFKGEIFDVAVDIRTDAETFGQWRGFYLSADDATQIYIPPGFAHGYCVISEEALFAYKCTDYYHPESQFSIRWNDPDIGIEWPLIGTPVISDKDRDAPMLAELAAGLLKPTTAKT